MYNICSNCGIAVSSYENVCPACGEVMATRLEFVSTLIPLTEEDKKVYGKLAEHLYEIKAVQPEKFRDRK